MLYIAFDSISPKMPRPVKGTKIIKLLLSQASRDMRKPLVPMVFPAIEPHMSDVEFKYCDNKN